MSTICKLDPQVRKDRAMRSALIKSYTRGGVLARLDFRVQAIVVGLIKVHRASRMTGATKQRLFQSGVRAMREAL